jgi:hypothetical protein
LQARYDLDIEKIGSALVLFLPWRRTTARVLR